MTSELEKTGSVKYLQLLIIISIIIITGIVTYSLLSGRHSLLLGQISKGDEIVNFPDECDEQYFLVTNKKTVWIIPSYSQRETWPSQITRFTGPKTILFLGSLDKNYTPCKYGIQSPCGCNNYLFFNNALTVFPKHI